MIPWLKTGLLIKQNRSPNISLENAYAKHQLLPLDQCQTDIISISRNAFGCSVILIFSPVQAHSSFMQQSFDKKFLPGSDLDCVRSELNILLRHSSS